MAEEVAIDLNIKTGEAEKNTQSLKGKLKQLKLELESLEEGSDAFNKIALEAAEAEDKLGDLSAKIKTLSSDTRKLDTVVGVAQGIAGGFAAAQGAAALFGVESEDLNKSLLKIQASLALLNGVQAIANTLQAEGAVATSAASAAKVLYTYVTSASTLALKAFRIALISTGIGAIIVLIGTLIAYWDDLTAAISGSTDAMDKQAEATRKNIKEMQEQQKALVQNTKDKIATTLAELEGIKAIREQMGLDTIAIDEKIRAVRLMGGATETELKLEQIKKETALTIEQLKDRAAKEAEQAAQAVKEKEAAKLQAEKDAQAAKDEYDAERKQADDEARAYEDEQRKEKKAEIAAETKQEEEDEKKAAQAKIDLAAKVAAAKQKSLDDTFALTRSSLAATQGLSDIFFQNQLNQNAGNDKKLREIKKKQFETNKIFTVSSIVLDTIMGMMKAIAASPPPSPVGIAGAVITGIAGTAATIKALAAKFDGGAQGSFTPPSGDLNAGGGGAPNNFAPQVPQTPQSIPIPQQVYVTETDITGTQQQVNVIEGLSKIQ